MLPLAHEMPTPGASLKNRSFMNIALVAFSVRGAMGQYLHCMAEPMADVLQLQVHAPSHFEYSSESYKRIDFSTGTTPVRAVLRLANPWLGYRVWSRVLAGGVDCVHLFNGEGYPWARIGIAICRRRRIPFVVTVHDAKAHSGSAIGRLNEGLRRAVLRNASALHVHTAEAARQIGVVAQGVPIRIIRHGDISPVFVRHRSTAQRRERRLALFFGRLETYKGIDRFLMAARKMDSEWRFILAGPGRISQDVADLIREIPGDRLRVVNRYLSDSDVAALLTTASVGVLPYRDATQSSLPSLCAAFGLPVVATRVGGLIEDVPLVGGLLVDPGDINALARGIEAAEGLPCRVPEELSFASLKDDFFALYRSVIQS